MSSSDAAGREPTTGRQADAWATTVTPDQLAAGNPAPVVSPSSGWRSTVLPRAVATGGVVGLVQQARPRYQPLGLLGEGGMGEVVAAQDHDIERKVAIKRLRGSMRGTLALVERFAREIRTVGSLEHPNIVPIHDVGVDENGDYFFVMKHLEGETLESIIQKLREGRPDYHARYSFEQRTRVFLGVLRAVEYAHQQGIIHRDLKPANVMVGRFGEVSVMDWGIAKRHDGSSDPALGEPDPAPSRVHATAVGSLLGTPAYMSPEQARGELATERSDIYALSVMFHELLCLVHPIAPDSSLEETLRAVCQEPVPLTSSVKSSHQPPPPMDLTWFIRRGTRKDPAHRYPSVRAMIDRLELRAEGIVPIECHITFTQRVVGEFMRWVNRHPLVFTTSLAISLAMLLFALAKLTIG